MIHKQLHLKIPSISISVEISFHINSCFLLAFQTTLAISSYYIDTGELLGCEQDDCTEKLPPQGWKAHQLKNHHLLFSLLIDILLTELFHLFLHIILTSKLHQGWTGGDKKGKV